MQICTKAATAVPILDSLRSLLQTRKTKKNYTKICAQNLFETQYPFSSPKKYFVSLKVWTLLTYFLLVYNENQRTKIISFDRGKFKEGDKICGVIAINREPSEPHRN